MLKWTKGRRKKNIQIYKRKSKGAFRKALDLPIKRRFSKVTYKEDKSA